ncbi:MAG: helix-turn-helix transcriptional regulator [Candidatus Ornithomonoglobus sp.]
MLDNGILGNAIRKLRIENGLSQEALAEMVGITPTHMKHIESEHRKPSIEVLFKLSEVLHLSLDNLLFDIRGEAADFNNALTLLKDCNEKEVRILIDIMKTLQKNRY